MEKPVIALFSDSNFLSLSLVENLLSKNSMVFVFAPDRKAWLSKTKHISDRVSLSVLDEKDFRGGSGFSYAVFNCEFEKFRKFYQLAGFKSIKSLAIFPFDSFSSHESSRLPINGNLGVIYVGDLIGPRIDLTGKLLMQRVIESAVTRGEMSLSVGEVFYPMFVSDAAREIVKWVFSFGPYGKEIFLLGNETSGSIVWQSMAKIVRDLELSYDSNLRPRLLPRNYEIRVIPCNLNFAIRETFLWLSKNMPSLKKVKIPRGINKLKIALMVIVPILLLPFICILINSGLFYWSFRSFVSGNSGAARQLMLLSKTPSLVGREESRVLAYIPIVGRIYNETFFAFDVAYRAADLGANSIYLADSARELADRVLGDEVYDPQKYSSEIETGLIYLYQVLSSIEADTISQSGKGVFLAKKLLNGFDFEKARRLTSEGANVADRLGEILGKNKRVSYLVLFQNNMELRPTGGFIGSFGVATFEGGRMTDLTVSDVYSADGQLKGHIEPPEAIRKYLGEANWWLRDSNWDPDFSVSAKRAEWFIDKEIDRQVEGVISFDLFPVRDLLAVTGPIYLADYEIDVTSENLYEKTQSEVHEDFFPGTHKKASFLTALSRNLVTEVSRLSSGKKLRALRVFYQSLEGRHIQAYLHDEKVQSSISFLNWSGEVGKPSCGQGCYADLVGVVEANVGVNKANYFITRDQEISIQVLPDKIVRDLKLTIKNSANPSLGLPGKYKAYIRILVADGSEPKEIEFLAEVLGGDTQEYRFSWSSPRGNTRDYGLYLRKQAGTGESDRALVAINGDVLYNSNLTKDVWIQNP